jgi:hypothetical protein
MAFPTNVLALASAVGSQFLATAWGGTVGMAAGLNQILADLIAVETKIGTGASTPTAGKVLGAGGTGTSSWRQVVAADISSSAAIAATKLAAGASNSVLIGGASNSFTASPTVASLTTTATPLQGGTTVKAGARIYPGALAGSTGVQSNASLQVPYLNAALAANTAVTIASSRRGASCIFDLTTANDAHFSSNSISTVTDRGSDATIQIGGADPGASSSKIWVSLSSGTLQIYNRYAAAHFIALVGWGMN